MPAVQDVPAVSLRAVMRPVPPLAPEDSLARFLQIIRYQPLTTLPVAHNGRLVGVLSQEDTLAVLNTSSSEERARALRRPVAEFMRPPVVVARPEMTPEQVGALCAAHRLPVLPVVDQDGWLLGTVFANDLLLPETLPVNPGTVGGMATPFGVYLTNGVQRGGVGDLALVASGMVTGVKFILSALIVSGVLWLLQPYLHLPPSLAYDIDDTPSAQHLLMGAALGVRVLVFVGFLLLMRMTRLSGYHAAEHQTVHAIERNERLAPEIVCRMPRAHPRCGTNLMAAFLLFFTLKQVGDLIPGMDGDSAFLIAGLMTLFTWRRVGTFLQEKFTTRPASEREIASGIAAGTDLIQNYLNSPPSRRRPWQRFWRMGLLQTAAGMMLVLSLAYLGFDLFMH
jgi:CBS domain-containing protein